MKRYFMLFISLILFGGAFVFAFLFYKEAYPYVRAKYASSRLADMVVEHEPEYKVDTTPLGVEIDFEKLKEINSDIIGWIYIPGTQVNYAICQHPEDNGYYLNHTPEKEQNILGSIYMYHDFAKDFSDPNTILFGHNMRSGQMFGELSNYVDQQFWKDNPDVYVYLPDRSFRCSIYSAYSCYTDDATFTIGYDYDTEEYAEFLEHTKFMSAIETGINPTITDQVLTLATCVDSGACSQRFIVNCIVDKIKIPTETEKSYSAPVERNTEPVIIDLAL